VISLPLLFYECLEEYLSDAGPAAMTETAMCSNLVMECLKIGESDCSRRGLPGNTDFESCCRAVVKL